MLSICVVLALAHPINARGVCTAKIFKCITRGLRYAVRVRHLTALSFPGSETASAINYS